MRKRTVDYELKKIDNTIVLTIGSLKEHNFAKFYFYLPPVKKNQEYELTEEIFNCMLEYEEEKEMIIKGKKEFINVLFNLLIKEGD